MTLGQREFRLVLDVLDAHPLGAPDEDGTSVRSVDDVVDDTHVLGLRDVLVDGVDEHREVVQQRPLGSPGIAGMELDEGAADLDARLPVGRRRRLVEAVASRYSLAVASGSAE